MTRSRRPILRTALFALCTPLAWTAQADVPVVVTDLPPVHSLVSRVMGELGGAALLLEQPGSAHSHALRPSQAARLQDSELVIWVGGGLSPWLARELPVLAPDAFSLELMALPDTRQRAVRAGATLEEEHDAGHEAGHEHNAFDPHGWLDPQNAATWLHAIADVLSEQDPANATTYRRHAADAQAELARLEKRLETRLSDVADRPFVLLHDGLGHFEHRFGLRARASLTDSDAQAAGPRRVQAVRDALASLDAPCLFVEAGTARSAWAPLVDGLDVKTATLDPLGTSLEPGPQLYGELLEGLAEAVGACLRDR